MRSTRRAAVLAALLLASCGDEGGGAAPPAKPAAAPPKRGAAPGRGGAAAGGLRVYSQIESLAASEKEAKALRHQFRETDFQLDPTGTVNRDPFRSFVINQPGVTTGDATFTAEPTDLCPAKRQIAGTYGARELKLTGIVARGTTRWALLSDTAQKGHIVHRNDCVGKEKGRVVEIGATYVKAEVSPEPIPNQPPRPPEVVIYQLHPQQLPIGESIDSLSPDGPRARDESGPPPGGGTRQ